MSRDKARPPRAARGYDSAWDRASRAFLRRNPLCELCRRAGRFTAATVTDHRIPHGGDMGPFWDKRNWQPLCARCHNSTKQSADRRGPDRGCDEHGDPRDKSSAWYRSEPHGPPVGSGIAAPPRDRYHDPDGSRRPRPVRRRRSE